MIDHTRAMHAKIQIGRNQLGLDDAAYAALLKRTIGKTSRAGCSEAELSRILNELARLGATFVSRGQTGKHPYKIKHARSRSDWQEIPADHPHAVLKRHICAIWRELGYSMTSLDTRVRRQYKVDAFAWLNDPGQLRDLAQYTNARLRAKQDKAASRG